MAPRDIEELSYADFQGLLVLLQGGAIGWTAHAAQSYLQYQSLHSIGEIIRSIVGKNYRTKDPIPFDELYPTVDTLARFGVEKTDRPVGTQAVAAFLGHMPDHIKEKLGVRV